jgi:PAS domain S-box-containing protein
MSHGSGSIARAGLVAAVEQAADGIVVTDTNGQIQYVNPAFTAMTGYTSEEAVGQNPRILKSGLQPAALYEDLWNTIRSGRVWHGELINRRKDGTLYDEEMRIAPVEDDNGEIVSGGKPRKRNGSSPRLWKIPRTPSWPSRRRVSSSPGTAVRKRLSATPPERRSGSTCPWWCHPNGWPAWRI